MPDIRCVLEPGSGIVRTLHVTPPRAGRRLLWSVGALLTGDDQEEGPFTMHAVGACGQRRDETLLRAAGEVVERWAVAAQDRLGPPPLFPDAGPSGAAAGPSVEFCRTRGLRELIERDAAMRGWYLCRGVRRLPLAQARSALGPLQSVIAPLCDRGAELVTLEMPSRCRELSVIMCAIIEPSEQIVACGLGCDSALDGAIATAAREACQIVDLFAIMREALGRPDRPEHLRSDTDRATWWGAPGNVTAFRAWLTKISTADQVVTVPTTNCAETNCAETNCAEMEWKSLVESTHFTDLTPSLPQRIRQGGWHAGRAENPALTPLVTDESALGQELVTPDTHPIPHPIL